MLGQGNQAVLGYLPFHVVTGRLVAFHVDRRRIFHVLRYFFARQSEPFYVENQNLGKVTQLDEKERLRLHGTEVTLVLVLAVEMLRFEVGEQTLLQRALHG